MNKRLKEIEVSLDGLVYESQVVNAVQVKDDLKWLIKLVKELEDENSQLIEFKNKIRTILEQPILDLEEFYNAIHDRLELLEESQ